MMRNLNLRVFSLQYRDAAYVPPSRLNRGIHAIAVETSALKYDHTPELLDFVREGGVVFSEEALEEELVFNRRILDRQVRPDRNRVLIEQNGSRVLSTLSKRDLIYICEDVVPADEVSLVSECALVLPKPNAFLLSEDMFETWYNDFSRLIDDRLHSEEVTIDCIRGRGKEGYDFMYAMMEQNDKDSKRVKRIKGRFLRTIEESMNRYRGLLENRFRVISSKADVKDVELTDRLVENFKMSLGTMMLRVLGSVLPKEHDEEITDVMSRLRNHCKVSVRDQRFFLISYCWPDWKPGDKNVIYSNDRDLHNLMDMRKALVRRV
ncbi:hypothetical protein ACFLZN_02370 [Nanoarchaeota archaeon]